MSNYRIIVADDHVLLRQGLKRIIEEQPGLEVAGEAGDGLELIQLLNKTVPDMVVLDISMPRMRGIEAVREIKSRDPGVKVLILTMHKDTEYLYQAYASGADGFLLKEDADSELFSAMAVIRTGGFYLSPSFARDVADRLARTGRDEIEPSFTRDSLSTRECEVLKLVAEGKSSKETADLLCISVRTVDHHRANIMGKLKIRRTADLVKYAINKGYVHVSPRETAADKSVS